MTEPTAAPALAPDHALDTPGSESATPQPETATSPLQQPENAFLRIPGPLRLAMQRRGFTELTKVQLAMLDATDGGRDLRISSQTGSGKTVAVGLGMAPQLLATANAPKGRPRGPSVLIVLPTRELAVQVHQELEWLYAAVPGVRVDSVTGGTHVGRERSRLRQTPQILVGTPGRLVDHITSGALDGSEIQQLVLDEADQMLDMGFREELDAILASMPAEGRRTHMLSATFPPGVQRLTEKYQTDPLHVEGTQLGLANADIEPVGHVVKSRDRYGAVVNLLLLAGEERTLIFVARRTDAAQLADKLAKDGFSALPLSGDLAQTQRTRTLTAFKTGTVSILVATDVAARGLDVPDVATVIHGDLPIDAEVYTHRSGRTGRAGRKGRSIMLATPGGERRARRLLEEARLQADWQPVPGAAEIKKQLKKRRRRGVRKLVEGLQGAGVHAELDFARSLLEDHDPAQALAAVIASLPTGSAKPPQQIAPAHIEPIAPRQGDSPREGERRPRPARHRRDFGPGRRGPGHEGPFKHRKKSGPKARHNRRARP
ncbi:MAG: DEAD/DEAH box helicase [Planctomycetota bacterium]|nr:DEAD/DEAH box helicase [Planctomycetota bacterium]